MTAFKNLHITDMTQSYLSTDTGNASMKSIVSVWNGREGVKIGWRESYGEWCSGSGEFGMSGAVK